MIALFLRCSFLFIRFFIIILYRCLCNFTRILQEALHFQSVPVGIFRKEMLNLKLLRYGWFIDFQPRFPCMKYSPHILNYQSYDWTFFLIDYRYMNTKSYKRSVSQLINMACTLIFVQSKTKFTDIKVITHVQILSSIEMND